MAVIALAQDATGIFFSMRLAALVKLHASCCSCACERHCAYTSLTGIPRMPQFPAGATFGGAFAMMPAITDPYLPAMMKRLHLLVAVTSVCNAILSVTMSTVAINRLSIRPSAPADDLAGLLKRDYDFLWCGCNCHFILAMLGLLVMLGLRSAAAFACPFYGRIGAFAILSSLLLVGSILKDDGMMPDEHGFPVCGLRDTLGRYPGLLFGRVRQGSLLTTAAVLLASACLFWTVEGFHHVWLHLYTKK
jgi:hypothetical protein